MLKYFKESIKGIVNNVAISLFFSSFFIVIINMFLGEKISNYISLINHIIVTPTQIEEKKISFDSVKKRLINYPNYGQVWANLTIPTLSVNAIVYHGDSLDLLNRGIGHYTGSYFPGEGGTILLAAHNSKEHFKGLPQLKKNDQIIIETQYGIYTYEVTDQKIMKATELEKLNIQSKEEELILYTCYPVDTIGYKSKRYVVYAKLVGEKI